MSPRIGDCRLWTADGDVGSDDAVIGDEAASLIATLVTRVDEVDAMISSRLLSRVGEPTSCFSPSESSMSVIPTSTDNDMELGQFTSPHTLILSVQFTLSVVTISLTSSTNFGTLDFH